MTATPAREGFWSWLRRTLTEPSTEETSRWWWHVIHYIAFGGGGALFGWLVGGDPWLGIAAGALLEWSREGWHFFRRLAELVMDGNPDGPSFYEVMFEAYDDLADATAMGFAMCSMGTWWWVAPATLGAFLLAMWGWYRTEHALKVYARGNGHD